MNSEKTNSAGTDSAPRCRTCKKPYSDEFPECEDQPSGRRHDTCDHWLDCQSCADECLGIEDEPEYSRTPPGWDEFCREFNSRSFQ